MKTKLFFISVSCFLLSLSFVSCGDDKEEVKDEKSEIVYDGKRATKLALNGVTIINTLTEVDGLLDGYIDVDQETSVALYKQNIDGILVFLKEIQDKNIVKLNTPDSLANNNFVLPTKAGVVEAFCYPHEVQFAHPIKLTLNTKEANGMDLVFSYHGKLGEGAEIREVKTDENGVYTDIPHFSYWVFNMNFNISVLETKEVSSEELSCKVDVSTVSDVVKTTYSANAGFATDTKNPFVVSFLRQWVGEDTSSEYSYEFEKPKNNGVEYFAYDQKVYVCSLTSGTKKFVFNVYGTPKPRHIRFE